MVADTYHKVLMPLAIVILPSVLAIFWGIACVFAKLLTKKNQSSLFLIIVFLTLFEYLRAKLFTGFPWLMPSIILSSNDYLIQIFSLVGSFTANLFVFSFSILPFVLIFNFRSKYIIFGLLSIPITILLFSSFVRLYNKDNKVSDKNLITLVQPNIEQKDKWNLEKRNANLNKLTQFSIQNVNEYIGVNRIIIWPETSFEGTIPNEMELLSVISKRILTDQKAILVVGLLRVDKNKLFNSLVFLNSKGNIIHQYDKIHLVPFGEYIPLRNKFTTIANFLSLKDFSSGNIKPNFTLKGFGNILTLICYEILFTEEVISRLSKNTNLLINITNDAWFGKTIGPYQHLALAKIKAVELGIPLARVANTGISALISPYGEEIINIPLYKSGVRTAKLTLPLKNTIYRRYGEIIFIVSILFLIFINTISDYQFRRELKNEK
jgi:apolipoprotein N-acyltransferase